jgi:hypothetical protein
MLLPHEPPLSWSGSCDAAKSKEPGWNKSTTKILWRLENADSMTLFCPWSSDMGCQNWAAYPLLVKSSQEPMPDGCALDPAFEEYAV